MIPTYDCAHYLRRALTSVLAQDPGPAEMQIEVIDDCSTADDPAAVIAEVGQGRVGFHRNARNLGATETFNVCLARARGHWVHILHGDDFVLDGYYADVRRTLTTHPDLTMVVGRVVTVDAADRWMALIGPDAAHGGGRFATFARQQAVTQLAQFAGVLARRDAYERVGGFCTLFGHVADWDMWFRLGRVGPVWCTPRPYGAFRLHAASDTNRHMVAGTNILEAYLATTINLSRLGDEARSMDTAWRAELAHRAYRNARKLQARGIVVGRLNQARWALRLDANPKHLFAWFRAWLACRVAPPTPTPP
jgi:GT2 family glycosyltransferase